jgi:hypothetical protein
MNRVLSILALIAFVIIPLGTRAEDAAKETITLRPATIALTVAAGEVTLQTVYFTNQSSQRKSFTVLRSDYEFDAKDSEALVFSDAGTTTDSVQAMLDFTPKNFDLDAGQTQELLVRVRPDVATKPGQYKGALFVGQIQQASTTDSIQVVGRVGTIIGVTITGASVPVGATTSPFSQRPSALVIALLLTVIFFFAGAGMIVARKAQARKKQLYL